MPATTTAAGNHTHASPTPGPRLSRRRSLHGRHHRRHRNTISNWRNHNPAFARELLNATRNRALEFRERAETLVPRAIRVLDAILDNDRASPSVRLRAALAVLKMAQPVLTREPAEGVEAREEIEAATIALPQNPAQCCTTARPSGRPTRPQHHLPLRFRPQIQMLLRHEAPNAIAV